MHRYLCGFRFVPVAFFVGTDYSNFRKCKLIFGDRWNQFAVQWKLAVYWKVGGSSVGVDSV